MGAPGFDHSCEERLHERRLLRRQPGGIGHHLPATRDSIVAQQADLRPAPLEGGDREKRRGRLTIGSRDPDHRQTLARPPSCAAQSRRAPGACQGRRPPAHRGRPAPPHARPRHDRGSRPPAPLRLHSRGRPRRSPRTHTKTSPRSTPRESKQIARAAPRSATASRPASGSPSRQSPRTLIASS